MEGEGGDSWDRRRSNPASTLSLTSPGSTHLVSLSVVVLEHCRDFLTEELPVVRSLCKVGPGLGVDEGAIQVKGCDLG